ncbi:MAG: sigma-E factor negative regulatory protein [Gammaproteobacteria bacterium]|nr:sigma-E factor negative regulatory protein [Gammaproteobacteria bacterium]
MSNTDDMNEKLSALVDNELDDLDERRVMAALEKDADLRRTWERYHLVRSALHQELDAFIPRDMAERVAARIGTEPADTGSFRRQKITRYAGTLAIAASVAVIAIASVQWFSRPASAPVASLAAVQPAPDNFIRAGTTRWDMKQKEPEAESALNAFLVEHNEFASSSGIGGMMPYVRVVGYDNPAK